MPISGLVITLSPDACAASSALRSVRERGEIEVGEQQGNRVPIVVHTQNSEEDREVWEWLQALPGVAFTDVVYVHFESAQEPQIQPMGYEI